MTHSVMVVDDDHDLRDAVCTALSDEGYVCLPMCNGRDALEALRSTSDKPDVIILDLMMPVMDGWEFRAAQKADPAICDVPVIVMTASRQASELDARAHLRKPLLLETLLDTLDSVLGR